MTEDEFLCLGRQNKELRSCLDGLLLVQERVSSEGLRPFVVSRWGRLRITSKQFYVMKRMRQVLQTALGESESLYWREYRRMGDALVNGSPGLSERANVRAIDPEGQAGEGAEAPSRVAPELPGPPRPLAGP